MFALVRFTDGIYYICNSKYVVKYKNTYVAKYKCGKRYTCDVLARNENVNVLNTIKRSLVANVPKVTLQHIIPTARSNLLAQNKENAEETNIENLDSNAVEENNESCINVNDGHSVNNKIKDLTKESAIVIADNTRHTEYSENESENLLTQATDCGVITCDIASNVVISNEDTANIISENLLPWNWNGNTFEVYEADTDALQCTPTTYNVLQYSSPSATVTHSPETEHVSTEMFQTIIRTRWTEDEKRVVLDAFGYYLEKSDAKLPTFNEIGNLIKTHPHILRGRNVATIKTWLHNKKRRNNNNNVTARE